MSKKLFKIVDKDFSEKSHQTQLLNASHITRNKEQEAKFERLWLIDSERFNPLRNCMERERLDRTWALLCAHSEVSNRSVLDIACGSGVFSRKLRNAGAHILAIDIAENALKVFRQIDAEGITLKRDSMPITALPDHSYDLIICTELIAELPSNEYRLFFAELARLIKPDGLIVCSSPMDIDSTGGVDKLIGLAQTEFDIIDEVFSHHRVHISLKRFFDIPKYYLHAWSNPSEKRQKFEQLKGYKRWWFWLNSTAPVVWFWSVCQVLFFPFLYLLKENRSLLLFLEKISRLLWDKEGVSHYMFIATRRPLEKIKPNDIPVEKLGKKQIWD